VSEIDALLDERYSLNEIVAASRGEPLNHPLTPRERWLQDYADALHTMEREYPTPEVSPKAYADPNRLADEREW
jgi:hypothetical protein